MKMFVSYTRRDGMITIELLRNLHIYLSEICKPFIHAIEEPNLSWQQLAVVRALFFSHAILLVVSPGIKQSPWVTFELLVGRILLRPIIRLDYNDLLLLENWAIENNLRHHLA